MYRTFLNNFRTYQQYLLGFAVVLFVLITSCPVKAGIKQLIGEPIKSEQSFPNASSALLSYQASSIPDNVDRCAESELSTLFVKSGTPQVIGLLPLILSATIVLFFFYAPHHTGEQHPFYRNLKISGTLPIFLQYRKLII